MGRFEDVVFAEAVATNAGPAAVAANLNQFSGYTLTGTDQINAVRQKGLVIVRLMASDETAPGLQYGDITLTTRREGDISTPLCQDLSIPGELRLVPGIPLPPAEGINYLGNASGAGAEMHVLAIRIWNPNTTSDFTVAVPPTDGVEVQINEMPTDANTAVTIDNFVDIAGRLNAYTNGQTALPDDQRVEIWLKSISFIPPADMGGIAVAMPGLNHIYAYPGASLGNNKIDFEAEFGGALYCTADSPILVAGIGNGAAAIPLVLNMIVKRPGGV